MKSSFTYISLLVISLFIAILDVNYLVEDIGLGYLGTSITIAFLFILAQQAIIHTSNYITSKNHFSNAVIILGQLGVLWTYDHIVSKFLASIVVMMQLVCIYRILSLLKSEFRGLR